MQPVSVRKANWFSWIRRCFFRCGNKRYSITSRKLEDFITGLLWYWYCIHAWDKTSVYHCWSLIFFITGTNDFIPLNMEIPCVMELTKNVGEIVCLHWRCIHFITKKIHHSYLIKRYEKLEIYLKWNEKIKKISVLFWIIPINFNEKYQLLAWLKNISKPVLTDKKLFNWLTYGCLKNKFTEVRENQRRVVFNMEIMKKSAYMKFNKMKNCFSLKILSNSFLTKFIERKKNKTQ